MLSVLAFRRAARDKIHDEQHEMGQRIEGNLPKSSGTMLDDIPVRPREVAQPVDAPVHTSSRPAETPHRFLPPSLPGSRSVSQIASWHLHRPSSLHHHHQLSHLSLPLSPYCHCLIHSPEGLPARPPSPLLLPTRTMPGIK